MSICDCCGDDADLNFYPDGICICNDCVELKQAFDIVQKVFMRIKKNKINAAPVTESPPNGLSELFESDS